LRFSAIAAVRLLSVRLTAGTRLGPYEILAPLDAGGMGEVYKARDTRAWAAVSPSKSCLPSIATTPFDDESVRFSPDGRAISFHSNASGRSEVYVAPFPPTGQQSRVSTDDGSTRGGATAANCSTSVVTAA
jgi:hypothetical protein